VHQARVVHEVLGSAHDGLGSLHIEAVRLDHRSQALGDLAAAVAIEQRQQTTLDPFFSLGRAAGMKR